MAATQSAQSLPTQSTRTVTVARPVSGRRGKAVHEQLQPTLPRMDHRNRLADHGFLGDVDEFNQMAAKNNNPAAVVDTAAVPAQLNHPPPPRPPSQPRSSAAARARRPRKSPAMEFDPQSQQQRSLKNWEKNTAQWEKMQQHLSKAVQKPPHSLAMQSTDNYRTAQEHRECIDQALPSVARGKGLAVGAEFWTTPEQKGGVDLALTTGERGQKRDVELISRPNCVRRELKQDGAFKAKWGEKSEYLKQRQEELGDIISDLTGHRPSFTSLEVVGQPVSPVPYRENSKLAAQTDADDDTAVQIDGTEYVDYSLQQFQHQPQLLGPPPPPTLPGPHVLFSVKGSSAVPREEGCRIAVTAEAGERVSTALILRNNGTCCVHVAWQAVPRDNNLGIRDDHMPRFFFNRSRVVLLPGEERAVPVAFLSKTHGTFSEQWRIECRPRLQSVPTLTLSALATAHDALAPQRMQIEAGLEVRHMEAAMRQFVYTLIERVRTPPPTRNAIDNQPTKMQQFVAKNPSLQVEHVSCAHMRTLRSIRSQAWTAKHTPAPSQAVNSAAAGAAGTGAVAKSKSKEKVTKAAAAAAAAAPPENDTQVPDQPEWDGTVASIRNLICELDPDARQDTLLADLSEVVADMSHQPPADPCLSTNSSAQAFDLVAEMIEQVARSASVIYQQHNIPLPEFPALQVAAEAPPKSAKKGGKAAKPSSARQNAPTRAASGSGAAVEEVKEETRARVRELLSIATRSVVCRALDNFEDLLD